MAEHSLNKVNPGWNGNRGSAFIKHKFDEFRHPNAIDAAHAYFWVEALHDSYHWVPILLRAGAVFVFIDWPGILNKTRQTLIREQKFCFKFLSKSDSISKPGGLIEAAKSWLNPFFNKEEKVVDNGVKRCDSDGFHAVTTPATKHAGGRPVKMDYLKGAPDEMVNTVLDGFGFSKQQKFYFRKRLGNNSTRKKGRPCKYAGMTEEQIRAKMMSEGKSKHDIAQQIRRNKKVKEAPQKGEQKVIGTQKNEGTKSNTFR